MILPTKKLRPENSLIYLGGIVLAVLDEPKTVSRVWEEFQRRRVKNLRLQACDVSFDWFVLALDMLHVMGTVEFKQGRLVRTS
jgi:hypothetical protein